MPRGRQRRCPEVRCVGNNSEIPDSPHKTEDRGGTDGAIHARITVELACHCGLISVGGPEVQRPFFISNSRDKESPSLTKERCRCPPGHSRHVAPCRLARARKAAPAGNRTEGRCQPEKQRRSCTALTKSSEEAALQCPGEKQRGSCTALDEKQRDAVLAKQN